MKENILNATTRENTGKGAASRLRREGMTPAIAYGPKEKTVPLIIKTKEIKEILRSTEGESSMIKLIIDNKEEPWLALIKDYQLDPVNQTLLHVDFYLTSADIAIKTSVRLVIRGEAPGVRDFGGILNFATREIEVECLPDKIPEHIEVNISQLGIHDLLRVKDLTVPPDVEVLSELEQLVVNVVPPAKEEEVVVEAVPEEVEEEVKEEEEKEEEKKAGKEGKEKREKKEKKEEEAHGKKD
jgi:large subunit ribosomal protein L25